MKKIFFLQALIMWTFILCAQDNQLSIGGEISTDNRLRITDNDYPWSWNENRLDLQLSKNIASYSKFNGDIWFRSFGFSEDELQNGMYKTNLSLPFSMEIKEANVQLFGFMTKNLDITIGRQRIAWGTGDKLNPTDNLNPYDFADIWDFGQHLGTDAIRADYYIKDFKLEGIFIPFFNPARLPFGDWSDAFSPDISQLPDLYIITDTTGLLQASGIDTFNIRYENFNYNYFTPAKDLRHSPVFGLKFAGTLWNTDFSISYVNTHNGFPLANQATVIVDSINTTTIDTVYTTINTDLIYPQMHIIGLDFAGTIKNAGVWGEIAINIPYRNYYLKTITPDPNVMMTDLIGLNLNLGLQGTDVPDSLVLDKTPYVKYVLGTDYTFGNGMYLNIQFLHGFANENGKGNLNDYLMLHLEKRFFDDKLIINLFDGAVTVSNWDDVENNYAWVYMPNVAYQATDNAKITLGARIIDGKGNGMFSRIKDKDEIFVKFGYHF